MVCVAAEIEETQAPFGEAPAINEPARGERWYFGDLPWLEEQAPGSAACETADAKDPFDDFEQDDFDDEFDDDFEEDWEDDLTEDEEFPDTFGGEEPDEDKIRKPGDGDDDSPFSDDPDFDEA
jgi:hypothetical protein